MSSYIMHICISDIIRKKYNLSDKYLYGCVLPDLKKDLGCDRTITHFIEIVKKQEEIRNLPTINKAINDLKNKLDFEVYLGYISHLIEDYIWFDKIIPLYTKKINMNEVVYLKDNTLHSLYEYKNDIYTDYRYFAKYVIEKCNTNYVEVIDNILNILNTKEKEIIIKNADINVNIVDNPTLLCQRDVDNYIEDCIIEVEKFINKLDGYKY